MRTVSISRKLLFVTSIVLMSIIFSLRSVAQTPRTWYFGQKAQISFSNNGNITVGSSNTISTPEGCAVYEGPNGSVQHYSNGQKLWDGSGALVLNGNNLNGSMNSCQSALFFMPKDATDTLYLLTTDAHNGSNGLCYSILTNAGLLSINKNIPLLPSATERMCLADHCDNKSKWLISHQWNSDAFYVYKFTEDSLIKTPVISHTGSIHNGNSLNAKGCIKANMAGTKVALAKTHDGTVELFHFNNITGELSDPILLTGINNAYGIEFSFNSNVLYVSTISGQLLQYSLQVWDSNTIMNSKVIINSQAQLLGSLQIGPDKLIYVSRDNSYYLGRIEIPYLLGTGCNYNPTAIYLQGKKCEAGLPQIQYSKNGLDFNGTIECLGDTSFYSIDGDTTRLDSIMWYFGNNPILDSSTIFEPSYFFNNIGHYPITLVVFHCGTSDTIVNHTQIVGPPWADLGPDTSFCINSILPLNGGLSLDYLWSTGATTQTINIDTIGIYWLTVSDSCGVSSDTVEILNIFPAPIANLRSDTTICFGDSVILDAGNDSLTNIWNTQDTGRYFVADKNISYFLEIVDTNDCRDSDVFSLSIDFPPYINLGSDTSICTNHTVTLYSTSSGDNLWQNGAQDTSIIVYEPGTYYCTVTNKCGEAGDTCIVDFDECAQIIWIQNAFTPNGDGLNDKFLPYIENVEIYHLYIFNRWGKLIFETKNQNTGWDGNYNGKEAIQGSYTWRIDYTDFAGKDYTKYGFVILIK